MGQFHPTTQSTHTIDVNARYQPRDNAQLTPPPSIHIPTVVLFSLFFVSLHLVFNF